MPRRAASAVALVPVATVVCLAATALVAVALVAVALGATPLGVTLAIAMTATLGVALTTLGAGQRQATRPAVADNAGATATELPYCEVVVDVSASRRGHVVEIKTPMGTSARRLSRAVLPSDRGLPRLAALLDQPHSPRAGSPRARAIERFGIELFDAVFVGAIAQLYRQSIDHARSVGRPLRIALRLDDTLAALPWEYLYDAERATYLALSPEGSLVRMSRPVHGTRDICPIDRLRVLVVRSTPSDADPLLLEVEHDQDRALLDGPGMEVRVLERPTLAALTEALDDFEPHVFHYCGHGRWHDEHGEGELLFETTSGHTQPVSGRTLGALLNRIDLRLAVFNACDTGRASDDRFGGVASCLVAQGVPAAIGMQFRMEDRAAAAFGRTLLAALARRRSLDAAVRSARAAVFAMPNDIEWATPVLTTRVSLDRVLPRAG